MVDIVMRRTLTAVLVLCTLLLVPATVGAEPASAPRLQAASATITSPQPLQPVRGQVTIGGSALHPQFQRYELYYKLEPGEDWVFIGDAHTQQVGRGVLGVWDTLSLPDGTYSLRLRVVRLDGNYDEALARQILVANAQPTETPTPEVSPTPTNTPTPLPPTPTVVIEQPDIPTPTPRPISTSTTAEDEDLVGTSSGEDTGIGGLLGLDQLADQIDPAAIRSAFLLGAEYALAAFVAVGAFFLSKRLLTWLWTRIRG